MHLVIIGISIGLLVAGIFSLLGGEYYSSLLLLVSLGVLFFARIFPENFLLRSLGSTVGPVLEEGMLYSQFAAKCSLFYAKIVVMLIAGFLVFQHISVEIDMSDTNHPVVLLLYLTPLMTILAAFASIFYALKFAYIYRC